MTKKMSRIQKDILNFQENIKLQGLSIRTTELLVYHPLDNKMAKVDRINEKDEID